MAAGVRATREAVALNGELMQLAALAKREFAADAVVFTRRVAGGDLRVVANAGVATRVAGRLLPGLASLERRLGTATISSAPSLSQLRSRGIDALTERGYQTAVTAASSIGKRRDCVIHILRSGPGIPEHEGLIRALACSVGLAIARPAHTTQPKPPPSVLDSFDQLALSAASFPDLIRELDLALRTVIGPVSSGIMLWETDRDVLQMVPGSFGADERAAASYRIDAKNSQSNAARVFVTGNPYVSNSAQGDPAILQDYVDAFGILRLLSVRLTAHGKRVGVLHMINAPNSFTVDDIAKLEPLIPRISLAVEVARTLFLLRRQQRLESVLSRVAVAIAAGKSMQDFLSPALDDLCQAMDASLIALVPNASAPIVWRAHDVEVTAERDVLAQARKQPPTLAEVTGPLRVGDPGSAAYHVPVFLKAQRVGTLSALRSRAEPFEPDEQSALSRLSKLAALAWATERYQQQRAELARIEERRRLADDLHDDVAQILFGAQIALDSTLELALDDRAIDGVVRARALIVKADEALRGVIHHLAPPPTTDLKRALGSVVMEVEEEFGLPIRLDVADAATGQPFDLGRPLRDAILRVARESLVNAAKHAGPCRATVRLSAGRNGRITLAVIDDGMGMVERSRPGHGVESLRRTVRAQGGSFRVESNPAGGTKVVATFPL